MQSSLWSSHLSSFRKVVAEPRPTPLFERTGHTCALTGTATKLPPKEVGPPHSLPKLFSQMSLPRRAGAGPTSRGVPRSNPGNLPNPFKSHSSSREGHAFTPLQRSYRGRFTQKPQLCHRPSRGSTESGFGKVHVRPAFCACRGALRILVLR